jgi:hypothetical protein
MGILQAHFEIYKAQVKTPGHLTVSSAYSPAQDGGARLYKAKNIGSAAVC